MPNTNKLPSITAWGACATNVYLMTVIELRGVAHPYLSICGYVPIDFFGLPVVLYDRFSMVMCSENRQILPFF